MSKTRRHAAPEPPRGPGTPAGKILLWLVVLTSIAALALLMRLARDILAQLQALGGSGGAASTRLLTGLFVVMCFGGFVAAALWATLKKLLGRRAEKTARDRQL